MGTCNKHTPKFVPWLGCIHPSAPKSASGKKKKKRGVMAFPSFSLGSKILSVWESLLTENSFLLTHRAALPVWICYLLAVSYSCPNVCKLQLNYQQAAPQWLLN